METKRRSFLKSLGYRIILILSNGIVVYAISGRVDLAINISILTGIINTLIYYFYERVWNIIPLGKSKE